MSDTVTYADRLGNGRQLSDLEIAQHVYDAPVGGGGEWRHIAVVVATILAESDGWEWNWGPLLDWQWHGYRTVAALVCVAIAAAFVAAFWRN